MNSDFKELLSLLNRFGVRYLVAGGYAVMLYTEPRYTKDLDVVIGVTEPDLSAFEKALEAFGFPLTPEAIVELRKPNRMISIGRPPARIDVLNELSGVDFNEAWDRRHVVDIEGEPVSFLSLQDLIAAKRAAGRPQDLLDLKSLEPRSQESP